jgi:hypothetical protein
LRDPRPQPRDPVCLGAERSRSRKNRSCSRKVYEFSFFLRRHWPFIAVQYISHTKYSDSEYSDAKVLIM